MRKKNNYIVLSLVLTLAIVQNVHAEVWKMYNVNTKHYFSVSAGGGYYSLLEDIPDISTEGGGAGLFGIGYEMRYNGFWFSLGADLLYGTSTLSMDGWDAYREIYDTQGKKVTYSYNVAEYHDTQRDFRIGVPLMIGFFTNGLYGGIGGKFSYAPRTMTTPSITYTTVGTYNQYLADFVSMPNHFYTDYTEKGTSRVEMVPQGSVCAELGYDILNKERMSAYSLCSVLKVAIYAEYGINSCVKGPEHDDMVFGFNTQDASRLTVGASYARISTKDARIVPFYVGIKVSFMLRIKTASCHCDGPL